MNVFGIVPTSADTVFTTGYETLMKLCPSLMRAEHNKHGEARLRFYWRKTKETE